MKKATIREVQHSLREILLMVEDGYEVEITRNKKVVAKLVPPSSISSGKQLGAAKPDYRARLTQIFGAKPMKGSSMAEILSQDRDR